MTREDRHGRESTDFRGNVRLDLRRLERRVLSQGRVEFCYNEWTIMHCPRCRTRLSQVKTKQGILFHCPRCNGRAAGLALLRRVGSQEAVRRLWMAARNSTRTPGAPCPICTKRMAEVPLAVRAGMPPMQLDVCPTCQFVWFDPREFEQFPAAPKSRKTKRDLPIEAREAIAMAELKRDQAKREQEADSSPMPTEPWHALPGLLGLPGRGKRPQAAQLALVDLEPGGGAGGDIRIDGSTFAGHGGRLWIGACPTMAARRPDAGDQFLPARRDLAPDRKCLFSDRFW